MRQCPAGPQVDLDVYHSLQSMFIYLHWLLIVNPGD